MFQRTEDHVLKGATIKERICFPLLKKVIHLEVKNTPKNSKYRVCKFSGPAKHVSAV